MTDRWQQADELAAHVKELNFAARSHGDPESIPYRTFLVGYLSGLSGAVALTILARRLFGFDVYATAFALSGFIYLVAAAQRPRVVYLVLRNTNWFALIRDPRRMRWIMLILGIALLVVGVLLQFRWLLSGTWL